eukprot:TRINITY_DN5962_c0_g1_i6.p1 TRINITY_DN5962_c0_g1~~TRINITY_DN5962_c0_g1_i6.p1  ORF type:complete len:232 (+),score=68.57 TRINITY_DN5962_c0_g1_i6:152-847(+)
MCIRDSPSPAVVSPVLTPCHEEEDQEEAPPATRFEEWQRAEEAEMPMVSACLSPVERAVRENRGQEFALQGQLARLRERRARRQLGMAASAPLPSESIFESATPLRDEMLREILAGMEDEENEADAEEVEEDAADAEVEQDAADAEKKENAADAEGTENAADAEGTENAADAEGTENAADAEGTEGVEREGVEEVLIENLKGLLGVTEDHESSIQDMFNLLRHGANPETQP